MQLKIPKDKAIEILEKRKSEIDSNTFEPKVWQHTTEDNLKDIFGGLDFKWTQISQITFDTHWPDFKVDVLAKGKTQAKKYIDSYIEQINEFTEIQNSIVEDNERYFEQENKALKLQMMEAISNANVILEDRNKILSDLNSKNNEIKSFRENTVQLNDITLNKLIGLIKNLPIKQTIALFTILFGIIGFTFWLGNTIKENSFLKTEYKLGKEINELNSEKEKLDNQIYKLNLENNLLKTERENLIENNKINTPTE